MGQAEEVGVGIEGPCYHTLNLEGLLRGAGWGSGLQPGGQQRQLSFFPPQKYTVSLLSLLCFWGNLPLASHPPLESPLTLEGVQSAGQILITAVFGIIQELLWGSQSWGRPRSRTPVPRPHPLSSSFYLVDFIQSLFLLGLQQPKSLSS